MKLLIKKEYFDRIKSGEKIEEFRDAHITFVCEETGETLQANALLGLHCQVMKNLGIFGEIGFGYTYGKFDSENGVETDVNTRRWGLANSGVGIVFYF